MNGLRTAPLLLLLAVVAHADLAVDRDGGIANGTIVVDKANGVAKVGRKKIPLAQLYLAETDDGTLLYAPDFDARVRGYEYVARAFLKGAYTKLVRESIQVKDYVLARQLLEKAEAAGLTSREAGKLKLKIEHDEAKSKGARGVKSQRLLKKAHRVDAHFSELLIARAVRALDGGRDGARLLRVALQRATKLPAAEELLNKIAPKNFKLGDARVWLDWHLDLEESGAKIITDEGTVNLDQARTLWRRDLHGVHADPILVVTPLKESALVGRCLAYGRLGCKALATLFKTDAPVRTPTEPMTVFLYENKREYMTTSGTGRSVEDPASLAWTAGHYSPSEQVSRFFWFSDPDAERRIIGTCVHELTHHWLQEHNPRAAPSGREGGQPAYWIVEGFATFMEEGIYDIDTGTWDHFDPRCRSLDVLQALAKDQRRKLIPWAKFYGLSQGAFHMLPADNQIVAAMRWELKRTVVSSRRLFYEQAAATCHFLYHGEDGKYRDKLIDFVCNYYSGQVKQLDPKIAFGLSADELGARTVTFAQAVAKGWRPRPAKK